MNSDNIHVTMNTTTSLYARPLDPGDLKRLTEEEEKRIKEEMLARFQRESWEAMLTGQPPTPPAPPGPTRQERRRAKRAQRIQRGYKR